MGKFDKLNTLVVCGILSTFTIGQDQSEQSHVDAIDTEIRKEITPLNRIINEDYFLPNKIRITGPDPVNKYSVIENFINYFTENTASIEDEFVAYLDENFEDLLL